MKKRIVISGYYGFANTGDEAVLAGMLESFRQVGIDAQVTVLSANPSRTVQEHPGVAAADRWKPWNLLREVLSADILVSGGGSLIQDATGPLSPYYYLSVMRLAQTMRRKTVVYAQGVGPLIRPHVKRAAAKAFNNASALTVRDPDSEELLRAIGVISPISVCADPSFVLDPDLEAADALLSEYGFAGRDFMAVSLRWWPGHEQQVAAIGEAIADCAAELGIPILYIAMQSPQDVNLCPAVAKHSVPAVFDRAAAPRVAKGLIARAGLVVGMRLHSLIFAASEAVPFVPIAYDPKVRSFALTAGIESASGIEAGAEQVIGEIIADSWRHRDSLRGRLAARIPHWKSNALEPARMLKGLL